MSSLDLKALSNKLQTQDNLFSAHPLYTVQEKKRIHGFDPLITEHGETVWIDIENGCEEVDLEKSGITEEKAEETSYLQETGFQDRWEFVNAHLTHKAAEEYIEKFSHRHKGELNVFVASMHNSPEMIAIREALLEGKLYAHDKEPWEASSEKAYICSCGCKPTVEPNEEAFQVVCWGCGVRGPIEKSEASAMYVWNLNVEALSTNRRLYELIQIRVDIAQEKKEAENV